MPQERSVNVINFTCSSAGSSFAKSALTWLVDCDEAVVDPFMFFMSSSKELHCKLESLSPKEASSPERTGGP